MELRRVVVTGLGTINPTGNFVSESWNNIKNGVNGIDKITRFDTTDFKTKLAGEVKGFDPTSVIEKKDARKMARFTQFAVAASVEAVSDSGISGETEDASRIGVIISSGIGSLPTIEEEYKRGTERGFEKVSPFFIPMTIANMAAGQVAIRFGFKGMCTCPVTACAGGSNAIGDAFHRIRHGYEDVMVCGGAESTISELSIGGFASMQALCFSEDKDRASIPFDKERSGFVMGEGGGVLVIEELEHAKNRGAKIYAEIVGYGANCDAYHMTAPSPDGVGGAECMRLALKDAGVTADVVDYINAHGTSTPLNDKGETAAIKTVFGEHAYKLAVSSTKSMTGHLLGGAGGVEAVFSVLALHEGVLPPTINYKEADPDLDLDYVPNVSRKADLKYALSNNLGFGGHNACLLFKKWEG